jgi:hypothetical protein
MRRRDLKTPKKSVDEMPPIVRKEFDRRQRELLNICNRYPQANRERANGWFDHHGANAYLGSIADSTRQWWNFAQESLVVRDQKRLEALANDLNATAPQAFLEATLPELRPWVERPSVMDSYVSGITETLRASLDYSLLQLGFRAPAALTSTPPSPPVTNVSAQNTSTDSAEPRPEMSPPGERRILYDRFCNAYNVALGRKPGQQRIAIAAGYKDRSAVSKYLRDEACDDCVGAIDTVLKMSPKVCDEKYVHQLAKRRRKPGPAPRRP